MPTMVIILSFIWVTIPFHSDICDTIGTSLYTYMHMHVYMLGCASTLHHGRASSSGHWRK